MYKSKKNGRCIYLKLENILKNSKKVPSSIKDMPSVFMWYFFRGCVAIYRFFKYVWYGLLWPIIFIVMLL